MNDGSNAKAEEQEYQEYMDDLQDEENERAMAEAEWAAGIPPEPTDAEIKRARKYHTRKTG